MPAGITPSRSAPSTSAPGITAGFEPAGGGYAEYVRVMPFVLPGVVRIPARNSFLEGAMLEPVNTVLKAVKRLALLRGDTVLVAGQGPIGLMFTRLLALRGMRVVATDLLRDTAGSGARVWGGWGWLKPEVRSPKAEGNPNPECRRQKSVLQHHAPRTTQHVSRLLPLTLNSQLSSINLPRAAVWTRR